MAMDFLRRYSVYALYCPVEDRFKYVGRSENPTMRYRDHKYPSRKSPCYEWIMSLREKGLIPVMTIIESRLYGGESNQREIFWIQKIAQHQGGGLLNKAHNNLRS